MKDQAELRLCVKEMRRTWIDENLLTAIFVCHSKRTLTSEDLRAALPPPPHPNWIGSIVARLADAKVIHEIGRVKSNLAAANGRKIILWEAA